MIGSDLSQQHPLLAVRISADYRHESISTYVVTPGEVREDQYAAEDVCAKAGEELAAVEALRGVCRSMNRW